MRLPYLTHKPSATFLPFSRKRFQRLATYSTFLLLTAWQSPAYSSEAVPVSEILLAEPAPSANEADTSPKFSFRAENVELRQALALFARANNLNIVPDQDVTGSLTIDFRNLPLDLAMEAIIDAHGYYFVKDGPLIRVKNTETRIFEIDYIDVKRSSEGSNAVQISSGASSSEGGGSEDEGSSMTVTANSSIDFWTEIQVQLSTLISEKGSATVNSLGGTIVVSDSHKVVENIAQFLDTVTTNITRQIELEIEIYEVSFQETFQLGIDWARLADSIDTGITGSVIVRDPAFGNTPGPESIKLDFQNSKGHSAVLEALQQQGDLKVISKPKLRTLNNQPAVIRVGQDFPVFVSSAIQSTGDNPTITVTEEIQVVTIGTILSITPQISNDGIITLDVTPAISRRVGSETSRTQASAPVIDVRQASSLVRLKDGETAILGGLVQESTSKTERKIPVLGDIPLLGKAFRGQHDVTSNTELIIFLTPRIISE